MPEAKEPVILSPEKIPQHADDTDVLVDKIIGMVKGFTLPISLQNLLTVTNSAAAVRRISSTLFSLHTLQHSFRLMQRQFRRHFYTML